MAETETLTIFLEMRPRLDVCTSRDRDVETETTSLLDRANYSIMAGWQPSAITGAPRGPHTPPSTISSGSKNATRLLALKWCNNTLQI